MKKIMKKTVAGLMMAGMISACSPFLPWEDNANRIVDVTALQIVCDGLNGNAMALAVGNTLQLTVVVTPADATDQTVAFASSDDAVATVTEDGLVTAIGPGTVTITVVSTADPTVTSTITLTVADVVMNAGNAIDQAEAESRKRK